MISAIRHMGTASDLAIVPAELESTRLLKSRKMAPPSDRAVTTYATKISQE